MELVLGAGEHPVTLDARGLSTHAVLLGMTGSGKTGLGVVLLEELLRARVPSLILDPKGDMGNLALLFPELDGASFAPWVDPQEAQRRGLTREALAEEVARRWRDGLANWSLDGTTIRELREGSEIRIYTPGSRAGIPVNAVGSLAAPTTDLEDEGVQEALSGLVLGLLGLVEIDADPFTSREAILLSNIIHDAWAAGQDLSFESLIASVAQPPMRKLGVFELETFYPRDERMKLAMRLNALVASPAFAPWTEGEPLDVGALLEPVSGNTPASIFYLAHLNDRQRMFFVTLLLGQLITWMRQQSGSEALRAALYMDEVFGFLPPTANPASKKPLLTLLKQARAFGVGLVLSTQNPVDLDYKALSNAGTWMIGRLQTERDQERIVAGLGNNASAATIRGALGALEKREFVLFGTRHPEPIRFSTRWAMAYLRGPMTRTDIETLSASESDGPVTSPPSARASAPASARRSTGLSQMPIVADGVRVRFVDPGAPWLEEVGGDRHGSLLAPHLAARLSLRFDERKADLDHTEVWEAILPVRDPLEVAGHHAVDFDERDFSEEAPRAQLAYQVPDAPLGERRYFRDAQRELEGWAYHERELELLAHRALGLYQRPEEGEKAFAERCVRAAEDAADAQAAKLREKYERKLERLRERLERAERKLVDAQAEAQRRKNEELASGAGALLDVFLGGRRSTSSILKRAGRKASGTASRRSRTRRSEDRAAAAAESVEEIEEQIADLEDELLDELEALRNRAEAAAGAVEQFSVRLEKNDIRVESLELVWLPVRE